MDKLERRVGLCVGVVIVFFILYLVYRDRPFASPELYQLMRIVLSLGVGIVGGTIPGFLRIKTDIAGTAIRAGGGLALFVLTFFFTPGSLPALTPPPAGQVSIDPIKAVDFRTLALPGASDEDRKRAQTAITMRLVARSKVQPSLNNTIEGTTVHLTLGAKKYVFPWRDFVRMNEENFGKWLGKEQEAVPFSVASGQIADREILHTGDSILPWGEFLAEISNEKQEIMNLDVIVETDRGSVTVRCAAEMKVRYNEMEQFAARAKKIPGRITTTCLKMGV